ncbi:MAG: hypothetical protein ACI9K4_001710 [Polaribacter sp.]
MKRGFVKKEVPRAMLNLYVLRFVIFLARNKKDLIDFVISIFILNCG